MLQTTLLEAELLAESENTFLRQAGAPTLAIMSTSDQKPFRVIMWCVPRSVSTATTKCFSFIENTQVWFEPYCMAFFQDESVRLHSGGNPRKLDEIDLEDFTKKYHDGVRATRFGAGYRPELINIKLLMRDGVTQGLETVSSEKSVFVKDMAYGITNYLDLLPSKESGFRHTFLIRDPERVFPSWRNLLIGQLNAIEGQEVHNAETFDMTTDVPWMMPGYSYKCQYDLWKYVKDNFEPNPVVIDVDEMLSNPSTMVPKYLEACGMPYDEKLLNWEASAQGASEWVRGWPVAGDGVTYNQAFASSCFLPSKAKIPRSEMTPDAVKMVDETMEYYKEMADARIKL